MRVSGSITLEIAAQVKAPLRGHAGNNRPDRWHAQNDEWQHAIRRALCSGILIEISGRLKRVHPKNGPILLIAASIPTTIFIVRTRHMLE